jgi:hypothetical protein
MKSRQKITMLSLACAAAFVIAGLAGSSPLTNITDALAATPEPVQSSCSAVSVTNIQSQSIALGAGEKITVDWSFASPSGDGGCVKVQNFEVFIEVTRRSGRTSNRKVEASSSARQASVEFTDTVDHIQSAKAVVTANISSVKGEKTQGGL